jgi:hypothetical protein
MTTELGVRFGPDGGEVTLLEPREQPRPPLEPKTYTFTELREIYGMDGIVPVLLDEIEQLRKALDFQTKETARACQEYRELLATRTDVLRSAADVPARLPQCPVLHDMDEFGRCRQCDFVQPPL